jgi:hypothetical protein
MGRQDKKNDHNTKTNAIYSLIGLNFVTICLSSSQALEKPSKNSLESERESVHSTSIEKIWSEGCSRGSGFVRNTLCGVGETSFVTFDFW